MVAIGSSSFEPTTALREDPAVPAALAARVVRHSNAKTIQRQERQPCHDAREPSRVPDACEPSRIPHTERDLASSIARSACLSPTTRSPTRRPRCSSVALRSTGPQEEANDAHSRQETPHGQHRQFGVHAEDRGDDGHEEEAISARAAPPLLVCPENVLMGRQPCPQVTEG